MAQSWLTVPTVVLSQMFTLLFIGIIGRVVRRKAQRPLGERSPRRRTPTPIMDLLAGWLPGLAEVINRSYRSANN
jgi:uncharacterized membrane protein YfcA